MSIELATLGLDTFVPMLEALDTWLRQATEHFGDSAPELVQSRLAPDMYPLPQQVMLSCRHAQAAMARLAGDDPGTMPEAATSLPGMHAQVADTLAALRGIDRTTFDGAASRSHVIALSEGRELEMTGAQMLVAWALPHFYFHVVTAYDILRHRGAPLGKANYLQQVRRFVRAPT